MDPAWAEAAVMGLGLGAWWGEPEYKVCGTFRARGYFILHKLQELDAAKFLTVTVNFSTSKRRNLRTLPRVSGK